MCRFIVCEAMFTVCESRVISHEMTHNSKHNNAGLSRLTKWLEILAGTILHQNSSEITENDPISCIAFKNYHAKIKAVCLSVSVWAERTSQQRLQRETEETNMYRGSDKITQLQCKRNRGKDGTPTADALRKCCQQNSQRNRSIEENLSNGLTGGPRVIWEFVWEK